MLVTHISQINGNAIRLKLNSITSRFAICYLSLDGSQRERKRRRTRMVTSIVANEIVRWTATASSPEPRHICKLRARDRSLQSGTRASEIYRRQHATFHAKIYPNDAW